MAFLKPGLLALAISSAFLSGCFDNQSTFDAYENSSISVTAIEATGRGVIETPVLNLTGRAGLSGQEVRSEISGVIKLVKVKEGHIVKRGDILATLDDTQLKENLVSSEKRYQVARQIYQAAVKNESLLKLSKAPDSPGKDLVGEPNEAAQSAHAEYVSALEARNADQKALQQTKVRAQIGGAVGRISVRPGDEISIGALLAIVTPEKNQWVDVAMTSSAFDAVKGSKSEAPTVTLTLLDGSTTTALIQEPVTIDDGRASVRLLLKELSSIFVLGDDVQVEIYGRPIQGLVRVPPKALKHNFDGPYVFVVSKWGRADVRQVEIVQWSADRYIRSGLLPGDRIVTSNFAKLRVGSRAQASKLESY